jgi:hypothetical protein
VGKTENHPPRPRRSPGAQPRKPAGRPAGRTARGAQRPAGTWLSAFRRRAASSAGDPPETLEESCAAQPRAQPPAPSPLAYRSPPRLGPTPRRPSASAQAPVPSRPVTPGRRAPGRLRAEPSARPPRHGCRWAPRPGMRSCSLGRRCAVPARAGGWGVGERGGGWDAAGAGAPLEGGGNRNVTGVGGGGVQRNMGVGDGEGKPAPPSPGGTPTPCSSRSLFLSRDSGHPEQCGLPAAWSRLHAPLPCQASLPLICCRDPHALGSSLKSHPKITFGGPREEVVLW